VEALNGYKCTFIGFDNYVGLLTGGASFLQALMDTLVDLSVNVPVVLIFSLFVAVLLNRKFFGRGLVRAIFFLPVIVTTGVVMTTFQSTGDANAVMEGAVNNGVMFETANASEFLGELGMNSQITEYMTMVADRIFSVVWDSGIQILLFLAALQGISPSLYEASDVEGATAWETFWLITFPNVAPIILVNIVYTIVDTFSDTDNKVLIEIDTYINTALKLGPAAAASWTFFIVILLLIGVVFLIFRALGGKND
jgi:ABC-type sugar transport system permease subunit